jgi:hypothetical protein
VASNVDKLCALVSTGTNSGLRMMQEFLNKMRKRVASQEPKAVNCISANQETRQSPLPTYIV